MSNVLINVVSEFDAKGFKQADSSFAKLTKSVAKFTAGLGLAYKTQQAMFNAMADEKATKILAQNLKNLGMAYAVQPAEQFIKQMQRQTGILDDELRPAYAQLARVTGDMAATQKILALSFDVSSGTGQDFNSVVDALSKAYVGNTRGLRSLNIGLTQAELQTKSFNDIVEILNKQFGGAGAAAIETYAGKYAILKVAAADASETIGKELLGSIQTVSGSTSITELADKINNLAEGMGALIRNAAVGAKAILLYVQAFTDPRGALKGFRDLQKQILADTKTWNERNMKVWYPEGFQTAEMKKAAAAALARSKQVLANNKKLTAEKKKQLEVDKAIENAKKALGTANNIFDLDRVSVEAAIMNQTLTDNERKRLEIKQAIFSLEDAINSQDAARISKQTAILNGLLGQFATLQAQDTLLGKINSALNALGMNKDLINLNNLQAAYDLLLKMNSLMNGTKAPTTGSSSGSSLTASGGGGITATSPWNPAGFRYRDEGNMGNIPQSSAGIGIGSNWNPANFRFRDEGNTGTPIVNISISESANDLIKIIYDTVTAESASGKPPIVTRVGTNLAW